MELIDPKRLGIGKCNPEAFNNENYGEGWNNCLKAIENAPRVDAIPLSLLCTWLAGYAAPPEYAIDHNAVCAVAVTQFNNHCDGQPVDKPLNTVTAEWNHFAEVRAFLVKYYGNGDNSASCEAPAPTITAKDRLGLVTVQGIDYQIVDIGLRMLTPRELFNAQGFPPDYIIDVDADGNEYKKEDQVARCGNAVCPPIPAALVRANLPELCGGGSSQ